MRCSACNAVNASGLRFCEKCGGPLVLACPRCGEKSSPSVYFCGACGASLGRPRQFEPSAARPLASWGEFKHATVLFADIVSSTELVAGLDPEEAMERLAPAIADMCRAVERFDGTVVRTLGDGVMALFGAPQAHEGHALLACEAALALQERFPGGGASLAVRVGLHSGEIVADPPLTEFSRERGAHGVMIHLASRLPSVVRPGEICLTVDCYRLVRSHCEARSLGPHRLKGIAEPVECYALVGLKPAMASQPFRGVRLATLRGRDLEFARLQRTLRRIDDGDSRVIGIVGAPGTGKSRLCYEFAVWCRSRLIPVFEARAQLYGHATPLQPMLEFLRSLFFRISPTDEARAARKRVAERLAEIGPTFTADLALVCEFLGVPEGDEAPPELTPKARRARLLDIVRHMVRYGGSTTSVIIIEDLHWLDEASEDFIATLVDAARATRTMLVFNYRPSYSAPWMQLPHYDELVLAELTPSETDALVEELVGGRPEVRDIRARVARRSDGNPFFAEELVRSLADNGALAGEVGNYVAGPNPDVVALPATVQAVIGSRIDRLEDAAKAVLQVCAVVGKEFPFAVLERVAGLPAHDVESAVGRLCDLGLLQSRAGAERGHYAFRHPLIQEVAYGMQLKARRAALHAAVADTMEDYYGERLDEFSALLSYHHEAAGQWLPAAHLGSRAARWIGSTDTAQAIKHWRKVRELMSRAPRSRENDALRIMASGQISWLGWREGLTAEEAKPFIQEALGWAREIDDTMVPLLLVVDGRITVASGGSADAYVERVKEALSLVEPGSGLRRYATLGASLSHALGWAGLLLEALKANDAALEGVPGIDKFDDQFLGYSVEHWAVALRGRILARLGRFAEAQACFDQMIEQIRVDPTVRIISHFGYVDIAWYLDDARLAERHLAPVIEISERHASPYLRVFALACSGTTRAIARDYPAAIGDFTESLECLRKTRAAMENEAEILASLADCHYRAGDLAIAVRCAREAIAIARERSTRLAECRASITCAGALLAHEGQRAASEAEALFERAEELIRLSGAIIYRPLLVKERERASNVYSRIPYPSITSTASPSSSSQ